PSPSATHARSSNQVGATRNHYTTEVGSADPNCGAFMEPRDCNPWQSTAKRPTSETAETSENRCRQLHGKEGSTVRVRQRAYTRPLGCRERRFRERSLFVRRARRRIAMWRRQIPEQ